MAPPNLQTLPPELQVAIVGYVPRPTDLKNLCLTSKAVRNIATPHLYREVTIDLSTCKYPLLHGFFRPSNIGQKFVRKLSFQPSSDTGIPDGDWDNALRVVRFTLGILPPDALLELSMLWNIRGDLDLLLLLATRQRRIVALRLAGAAANLDDALSSPISPAGWPRDLKTLSVAGDLKDMSSIRGYAQVIREARSLEDLSLNLSGTQDFAFADTLQDSAQFNGALANTLFGHIAPFGAKEPLVLQRVRISGVCLSWSDRTFARVIDFCKLTVFAVINCEGAAVLLNQLAGRFARDGCALKKFQFAGGWTFPVQEVCAFLRSWSGLETLVVTCTADPADVFDLSCLDSHFQSLKVLSLELYDPFENGITEISAGKPAIDLITSKGRKLQELGVTLAARDLLLPEGCAGSTAIYPASLEAVIRLPELRLLCVGNWPLAPASLFSSRIPALEGSKDSDELQELNNTRYFALMDRYATNLLSHIVKVRNGAGLRRLAMLCFGSVWAHETGRTNRVMVGQQCYVPGIELDVYGQARVRAIRMSKEEVKWEEGGDDLFQRY
ncbi:hypothetical protein LTR85_003650 [Meristemomyces frigidus]|nr:hypothetical protein LTR85_003650 [Meristemomyces frigidus]